MTKISNHALNLLSKPRTDDVLYGAVHAWGYFTVISSLSAGLWVLLGEPQWRSWALVYLLGGLLIGGAVAGLITFTWGLTTAILLSRALRRTRRWLTHLLAFLGLGAVTGFLTWVVMDQMNGGYALSHLAATDMAWLTGSVAVTAIAVGGGWATSWHHAQNLSASVPDETSRTDVDLPKRLRSTL